MKPSSGPKRGLHAFSIEGDQVRVVSAKQRALRVPNQRDLSKLLGKTRLDDQGLSKEGIRLISTGASVALSYYITFLPELIRLISYIWGNTRLGGGGCGWEG